ncbi:MAG: signal peptidase I [Bacteroidales bacterium]|jgi:signal peptidase I|nr:signal peptidase I [Bacteroidales bacterium]
MKIEKIMLKSVAKSILKYFLFFVLSLLLALTVRLFLFNFYSIPSDSMEPALLPGDFIVADKLTYGARIFTGLKYDSISDPPMVHAPGFRNIRRNDVVVFNFPYRYEWDVIRMSLDKIFVKRCIGLPGDSVSIVDGYYHVAGIAGTLGYIPGQKQLLGNSSTLDPVIMYPAVFDSLNWDIINLGPLYVPAAGDTVELTPENFYIYHKMIVYETNAVVQMKDSLVYINDAVKYNYTFSNNWYFMAGDKVINSQDSRYIGLIPEDYIIGKASFIWKSKDPVTGKYRFKRFLKKVI